MAPAGELDPLSQLLGEIKTKVELVLTTQAADRVASAQYRTDMRRDLATVKETVQDLKHRTNSTADDVAELRADWGPDIKDYRTRRDQGTGMWTAAKTFYAILTGLGAAGIGAIIHAFWPKS